MIIKNRPSTYILKTSVKDALFFFIIFLIRFDRFCKPEFSGFNSLKDWVIYPKCNIRI